MSKALTNLEAAYAAFQAHGLAKTSKRDQEAIHLFMMAESTPEEDREMFDFITARTKVAARVEWQDYPVETVTESELRATTDAELPPVTHSLVETAHVSVTIPDARPVLYFQQDGAFFCYRDRPFYYVDFEYVGPDGTSAGVCPAFSTVAPFYVADFDIPGAEKAAAWFAEEAAKAGFRVERACEFYSETKPVPCHPDEELADIAYARHPDRDLTSIAEFVVYRATPQAPVKRELFDTFETWRPAYLNLIENWYGVDVAAHAAELCEEYYTESLTPIDAARSFERDYQMATQ